MVAELINKVYCAPVTRVHVMDRVLFFGSIAEGWNGTLDDPPLSAVCMHVRHGDKYRESSLHNIHEYLRAADDLLVRHNSTSRNVFLTTDNGTVIDEVEKGHYQGYNLTLFYTRYDRHTGEENAVAIAESIGKGLFGSILLANLVLATHPSCKWFVGTTSSNQNRLIDELARLMAKDKTLH